MDGSITPFTLPDFSSPLRDLRQRLEGARWPDEEPVNDWSQGVPLNKARALHEHWLKRYDWRRCETLLNDLPQFSTEIDGVSIYFIHVKSKEPDALPLLLTHGWPGSVLEFRHVIEPLTDPVSHHGSTTDAFDVVIPALPGYGFSGKPKEPGWSLERIAKAWIELMRRLGHTRWVAQGGDWGGEVSVELGRLAPAGLLGVHINSCFFNVEKEISARPSTEEKRARDLQIQWDTQLNGYQRQQSTRPQTLGYSLTDSPLGLATWIYEKLHTWSGHDEGVEAFSMDEMLDNIMLYWLSGSGASASRIYWEGPDTTAVSISLPVGVSQFPADQNYAPREWAERYYSNIVHWRTMSKGGHFAAWEQPDLFVREMKDCFRLMRANHRRGSNVSEIGSKAFI